MKRFCVNCSGMVMAAGFCFLFFLDPAEAVSLKVVTHFHSSYSHHGNESLETIVEKLRQKGIDVFIPTDTLIATAEYGSWPLRSLIKKTIVRPSILSVGPERYLADIQALRLKYPGMLIIPGTEAAAYYRWEGSPWTRLMLDDWNRHILILGLQTSDDFRHLPVIGNPPGGRFNAFLLWPLGLLSLAVPAWFLRLKVFSGLFAALGVLFLWNNWPYRDIDYDSYEVETAWAPYQQVIDYSRRRGALAVWAHPDAGNWQNPMQVSSRVFMRTAPYPDAILRTVGHAGFGVFMEGLHQTGVPGGTWDLYLDLYQKGRRSAPIWAFAETDYHADDRSVFVDTTEMIVSAKSKTAADVLDALKTGHFYSVRSDGFPPMIVREWKLIHKGSYAETAETLNGSCRPQIALQLAYEDGSSHMARVQFIRDGKVIFQEQKKIPDRWEFADTGNGSQRSVYRVLVQDDRLTWLVANPIFCSEGREGGGRGRP